MESCLVHIGIQSKPDSEMVYAWSGVCKFEIF